MLARVDLEQEARVAAFSSDGARVAVGLANGAVAMLRSNDLSSVRVRERVHVLAYFLHISINGHTHMHTCVYG